ncbi:MAG: phosphomannomutase [Methylococcaceae bacterium]|nr:MAG: phosphomannomutase [Methylococcaceae bacterium]
MQFNCFKAYDIRGQVPDELNEGVAYRIGRAYAAFLKPREVVVGYDIRLESPPLAAAVSAGLMDGGADVLDIGLCGTEEVYFATFNRQLDGGIMVTASHNPKGHNGMKLVREQARPISSDDGLLDIKVLAESGVFPDTGRQGSLQTDSDKSAYIAHLLSYVDISALKRLRLLVNPGNGGAGIIVRELLNYLHFDVAFKQDTPDGHFPFGVPNPLLPENRAATASGVLAYHADMGIAWDGDFDRCFLFDAQGRFIEGYYVVGLLAEAMLTRHPGAKIIHDPRLTWNTIDQVRQAGGIPVQSKTGHAFIKARMRQEDAVYGGEMSAHHYFRDFSYCDSGMIPWLLVCELMSRKGLSLAELVDARMRAYPCSGEINYVVADSAGVMQAVAAYYAEAEPQIDHTDGLSLEFADWRFNLRSSNTEPLLRLNVETRADGGLLARKVAELEALIRG